MYISNIFIDFDKNIGHKGYLTYIDINNAKNDTQWCINNSRLFVCYKIIKKYNNDKDI